MFNPQASSILISLFLMERTEYPREMVGQYSNNKDIDGLHSRAPIAPPFFSKKSVVEV